MKTHTLFRSALLVALACACGWLAAEARAQAYKYKDAQGQVHFTENIYDVPERYRAQVETREMPALADPNAPEPAPKAGTVAASVEDGLRKGIGHDLTVKQEELVHAWTKKWAIPFVVTLVINVLIGLAMVVHAFVSGKIGWGLANFFLGVSSPFYLMLHLEINGLARIGLLALYLSPMIVVFMAMGELTRALG